MNAAKPFARIGRARGRGDDPRPSGRDHELGHAALRGAVDAVGRPPLFRHGGDGCPICETDCDSVTDLKRRIRALEQDVLLLAYALVESRELREVARTEIDARFPAGESAAA